MQIVMVSLKYDNEYDQIFMWNILIVTFDLYFNFVSKKDFWFIFINEMWILKCFKIHKFKMTYHGF